MHIPPHPTPVTAPRKSTVRGGGQWGAASPGPSSAKNSEERGIEPQLPREANRAAHPRAGFGSSHHSPGSLVPAVSSASHIKCPHVGSSQAPLLSRARETQAPAGTSDVALAVVQVKMMEDRSKTLTSRMPSRGRNGEVVEEEPKSLDGQFHARGWRRGRAFGCLSIC